MRVYLAGPMRHSYWLESTRTAIDAADELLRAGLTPVVPQLSSMWSLVYPHPIDDWLRMDLELVEACHCVLRLPGESEGADREVSRARLLNIPVFDRTRDVIRYDRERRALHSSTQTGHA